MKKKIVLASLMLGLCSVGPAVTAESITDLQGEKQEQEKKKEEAEGIIEQLREEQGQIQATIDALDLKVREFTTKLEEYSSKKEELNVEISDTQVLLDDAELREQEQYEAMKQRIQYSYENGDIQYVDTLFSTTDVSDIVCQSEYIEQIYNYDSNQLNDLIGIRTEIAEKKSSLETDLSELEVVESGILANQEAIQLLIEGKMEQLGNYNDSIDEYIAQKQSLEAEIAETEEKIRQAEEEARRKAQQAANSGGHVYNYTGGKFCWPVSTGGIVTSEFGPRWGTIHQGLDIACPTGTPILAGEDGVVIASFFSPSAGEYIVIDHGNGYSTEYMHNSVRLVSAGDHVVRGQVIAYAGNTGNSFGSHCHFGVRVNGVRVDPYPYLK